MKTIRQLGPFAPKSGFVLCRLKVGERIRIGDWCFDARVEQPVEVIYKSKPALNKMTESHHPHFRIVKRKPTPDARKG